ncbi:MAG TPA: helix-turn-helix domain-containing protein [Acetobacteraceae bacterium]|nr:helix-turn-helix domain-containing protein [Acetobacteraceae bacterium]
MASIHALNHRSSTLPAPPPAPANGRASLLPGFQGLAGAGLIVHAERDAEIVAQGDRAEHCYIVISGWLRTVTLMEDGRRQVGLFLTAGDLFGWDVIGEYDMSAEAVTDVVLRRVPMRCIDNLAERDPDFARRLRRMGAEQLRAARERMVLLGRMTALERIAHFLLETASRARAAGGDPVDLPMSRADIADHLGLTVETVCRGLSQLRRMGAIALDRHGFRILDRSALRAVRDNEVH